jgi:hypothetical protein
MRDRNDKIYMVIPASNPLRFKKLFVDSEITFHELEFSGFRLVVVAQRNFLLRSLKNANLVYLRPEFAKSLLQRSISEDYPNLVKELNHLKNIPSDYQFEELVKLLVNNRLLP